MKVETRTFLQKARRIFVVGKFTMQRGYGILNIPMVAAMGAGIIYPYTINIMPGVKMWHLAIIAFTAIMFAGWLDRKLRVLHEEQNYTTETNPMLMAGLRGELNKHEKKEETKEEVKEEQEKKEIKNET